MKQGTGMRNIYFVKRRDALSTLSTEKLAIAIGDYFDTHACLPGQKALKDAAEQVIQRLSEEPEFDLSPDAKAFMAENFANVAVREMKVGNLKICNVTKATSLREDRDTVITPADLALKEVDSEEQKPRRYLANARIEGRRVLSGDHEIGLLPEGFAKNNPAVSCPAVLVLTDYSTGKFANVSYHVIVDFLAA